MGRLSDRIEKALGANVPVKPQKQVQPPPGSVRRREKGKR